jgi:hypothetical protein
MITLLKFTLGITFDTRSVLMGISGLFCGALPAAMAMTAVLRYFPGGAGTWTGVRTSLTKERLEDRG